MNIEGERVALGPLVRELIPTYHRWHNDLSTLRTLLLPPAPLTAEAFAGWYERWTRSERDAWFTICERAGWEPVGVTALDGVDYRHRTAELHMVIGEARHRGRGYGTEAARLVLDYAFVALGLESVMLMVAEFNAAGRRAYERAGFREFGRRRRCRMMGGRMWDQLYMECLASEFESPVLERVFAVDDSRPPDRGGR